MFWTPAAALAPLEGWKMSDQYVLGKLLAITVVFLAFANEKIWAPAESRLPQNARFRILIRARFYASLALGVAALVAATPLHTIRFCLLAALLQMTRLLVRAQRDS